MDPYDGFDVDLIGEAPCEFCGDMWPLALLTEHQSIHLVDENYYFENLDNIIPENVIAEEISTITVEPEVIAEQLQQSSAPVKPEVIAERLQQSAAPVKPIEQSSDATKPAPAQAANNDVKTSSSTKQPNQNEVKKLKTEKIREFTRESGEKTIFYGTDIDHEKDFEDVKQYKVPNNPLLNSKEDDIEDINNLSDDDCSESLEEFWKRARDYIRRNKARC